MPRPASKKKSVKPIVKGTTSSSESAAEKELKKMLKQLDAQREKLCIAKDKLREKRTAAKMKKTAGSAAALEKAYATVATHAVAVSELTNAVRLAKAEVRAELVLKKIEEAQATAVLKLEKLVQVMADDTAADLKLAVEKFEKRWLKQREQANAKKLKLATARLRAKTKGIERKANAEASAIRKRAKKLSAKPVAIPGRPGRPSASFEKTTKADVAPKRRGRPRKVVADEVIDAPKRRGRPPKTAASPVKGAIATGVSTQKKRGRPPKAKPTVAAKETETTKKAKVTTSSESTTSNTSSSKLGEPKKRGRPRKVVKS